jgi:glycosyltransferase involved in cell wall biosynthesis
MVIRPLDSASDFEKLFGAIKNLAEANYEFVLVVIGDGKADSAVRKMIRMMGLSQIINIVPNFPMLRAAMSEADICIRPRPVYAFSVPLLEAMSVGMVVAGCRGGVDDLLIENDTTVLFNPDDQPSIFSALKNLLDDKIKARQIAANAQAYLRQHNTVSMMMTSLIGVYRRASEQVLTGRMS